MTDARVGPLGQAAGRATGGRPERGLLRRWTVARALLLLPGLAYLLVLLYHGLTVALFPYDLDYGEGYVLNDALRLLRGEPLYGDIIRFPMVRSPYPPLVPAITAPLLALLGPGFLPGRLLGLAAALATAGLVFLGVRRATDRPLLGALAASVYLGSPHLYQWAAFQRVDTVAVLGALGATLLATEARTARRAALAGALAALALLSKQTMVAAPAAIGLWLLVARPRLLPAFLAALAAPLALFGGGLLLLSAGRFADHVLLGNAANPFHPNRLLRFQLEFWALHLVVGGVALGWSLAQLPNLRSYRPPRQVAGAEPGTAPARDADRLLALYALAAFAVSLSVGNAGSSVNYFLEFLPAACLAAGAAAGAFLGRRSRPTDWAFLLALAGLQLALLFHVPNRAGVWVSYLPPHGDTPVAADWAVGARLDELVRMTAGDVLLEPAGFAARNGRAVLVQPIDLRAEQVRGRWRPDDLVAAIAARRFGLIVLSYRLLPAEALAAIERHYVLVEELRGPGGLPYRIYRPGATVPIVDPERPAGRPRAAGADHALRTVRREAR